GGRAVENRRLAGVAAGLYPRRRGFHFRLCTAVTPFDALGIRAGSARLEMCSALGGGRALVEAVALPRP
ncbi:MAG: hypothetical protein ACRDHP_03785, partial [Ktedonobacterales bacterium]